VSLARGPLFLIHGIFATLVVLGISMHLQQRELDVQKIRSLAHTERTETARLQHDIAQQEAIIDGLRQKDPYVVEMVTRDKLRYTGNGEITPPPRPGPVIDNPRATGTK
jgi:cell division protein FtsB